MGPESIWFTSEFSWNHLNECIIIIKPLCETVCADEQPFVIPIKVNGSLLKIKQSTDTMHWTRSDWMHHATQNGAPSRVNSQLQAIQVESKKVVLWYCIGLCVGELVDSHRCGFDFFYAFSNRYFFYIPWFLPSKLKWSQFWLFVLPLNEKECKKNRI